MKGILKSIKRGVVKGMQAAVTLVTFCVTVSILGDFFTAK